MMRQEKFSAPDDEHEPQREDPSPEPHDAAEDGVQVPVGEDVGEVELLGLEGGVVAVGGRGGAGVGDRGRHFCVFVFLVPGKV